MPDQQPLAGLILAAGKGTRMKSAIPKCLHPVCGLPMAEWVIRAMKHCGIVKPIVVVGHGSEHMRSVLGDSVEYAIQEEQLGTGHAVLTAKSLLADWNGTLVIAPGDTPLLDGEMLGRLVAHHLNSGAAATLALCRMEDPTGYGRVVVEGERVLAIVEERDATENYKRIRDVNTGLYCFDCRKLFEVLPKLENSNSQGEYYLTDVIGRLVAAGAPVEAVFFTEAASFAGVNDRWQLAGVSDTMRMRILQAHAEAGVTIVDPRTTYIDADVTIGSDSTVGAMSILEGSTAIGCSCQIGPGAKISNSQIGSKCTVLMSLLNRATLHDGARCGPYANLRPGAVLGLNSKVGNFVEIKNAELAESVSVSHLSYIGDASIGAGTNIGAGTITCNYDGFQKNRTEIGADAFIGSNSTLLAPITIGDGAMVAAGSVVDQSVPADALAFGRARQENKLSWVKHWRERKRR